MLVVGWVKKINIYIYLAHAPLPVCFPLLWSQVVPSGSGINKGMDSLGKVICFPVLAKEFSRKTLLTQVPLSQYDRGF